MYPVRRSRQRRSQLGIRSSELTQVFSLEVSGAFSKKSLSSSKNSKSLKRIKRKSI